MIVCTENPRVTEARLPEEPGLEEEFGLLEMDKVERPPMYKVLLHNDDYTPMEFVVMILVSVFRRDPEEAVQIMLAVHQQGVGVAGVYSHEVAEAKVDSVIATARGSEFALMCSMEPE